MSKQTETYIPKANEIERKCFVVDAKGWVLGRLATRIARVLLGKDEVFYTPYMECGDQVVVVNVEAIRVTGKKSKDKMYDSYSGYPGGRTEMSFEELQKIHPDEILTEAVRRMLPKNRMRDKMMKRLRVFAGPKHSHLAQKPIPLTLS